ncbi:MAG: TonB-dependent receptor, partial [Edaphobacter sp.]
MQISRTTLAKRQSLSAEISPQYLPAISRTGFRIAQVTVLRLLLVLGMVGVVSFWTASEASAQQVFGSIDGTVTDSTGAAVVGGTVRVTETTKGVTFTQTTNSSGFYSQGQLIPGTYAVSVEALGFKKAVSTPVTVNVDQVSRFDTTLSLGSASETIQVTSAAPLLQTDRVDIATTLTSEQILTLPEYQRNFLALEFLTPGVLTNSSSTSTAENPQGSFRARVNGQMWGTTGYQLDGTDNQDAWLGSAIINPSPDSVAESKFSTQNYDAENGYVAGGMFIASTKSGSNDLHGSLFEYLINNSPGFQTVGINPFTPSRLPPLKSNQFGGSIGGHIIRDKLFYFGDIQIQRRREGETLLTTVPTALVHQTCGQAAGVCDLSQYLNGGTNQVYDPNTGNAATGQGRTPFANNQIPVNRISPQALNLLAYFPLPNFQGPVAYKNNYIATGAQVFDAQQYNTRIDYYLNEKNLFFGRYTHAGFNLSVPGAFGVVAGGPGLDSSGFSGISNIANQSLSVGYTHIFNPKAINEFRFGFYRYNVHEVPGGYGSQPATQAGIPNLNMDNTLTSGMPAFNITGDGGVQLGYSNTINRCNCTLTEIETSFQLVDNLTKIVGNHTLKFGTDLKRTSNLRAPSDTHRSGELTFAPGYTGLGNANGGAGNGLGLATFLLGQTTTFGRYVSTVNDATAYLDRAHFYGQDTWHPTSKLTLSYGLRWELTFPEATDPGKGGLLDLNTGNVVVFGVGGNSSRGFQQMVYHNFAPRLGVSYQATPKTVLRVGYGWAYAAGWAGSVFNQANISLPVLLAQSNTPANASQGVFTLATGPATLAFPTVDSTGMAPLPNNITQSTRPHTITLPVVYSYNAAIQQQLTKNIAVTAAYVGNSGRHTANDTLTNFNVNQAPFVPGVTNLNTIKPY